MNASIDMPTKSPYGGRNVSAKKALKANPPKLEKAAKAVPMKSLCSSEPSEGVVMTKSSP